MLAQPELSGNTPRLFTRRNALRLFGTILPAAAVGCYNPPDLDREEALRQAQDTLAQKGLVGEHPIVDLRSVPGFSARGDISGGFISFTGTFEGQTTTMIQFAWRTAERRNPQIVISEIPFSRVIFNIVTDGNPDPTVNFNLDPAQVIINTLGLRYLPLRSDNPNDYVRRSTLTAFTLSEGDYTNFRVPSSK